MKEEWCAPLETYLFWSPTAPNLFSLLPIPSPPLLSSSMAPKPKRSAPLPGPRTEPESEARRLKSIAESKLRSFDFKSALKYARRARRLAPDLDGLPLLVTALKILRCSPSDHYKILRLDPFSPPSVIRSQYKTLALSLHPDKAPAALGDAFKRVADSFRFLSDRSNKKRFDDELRVRIAGEATGAAVPPAETFWTACDTCRILHEFDRRYVGHRLVCPSCRKSFLAAEVKEEPVEDGDEEQPRVRVTRARSRTRPRVPTSWGSGVRKRKIVEFVSSETMRARPRKEKTLAEIQLEIVKAKAKKKANEKAILLVEDEEEEDSSVMAVEDSDFYDFDKDRTEKSFVKGQIWAVYDDDDVMPRHYGLIEDVISSNPFRVKMCWLDVQSNGDEALLRWEESGYHISCGRFKVGRKVNIDSVNLFSHLVECERAAKELYRIYPKKGSVWALYGDRATGGGDKEDRCYDVVVFLTSYSEMYGLSMVHLEKVEGYKTVFKRQKTGAHAVTWLEKEDVRLFSHQIPARKLSGEEDENLPRECWELDPAALPSGLIRPDSGRKCLA